MPIQNFANGIFSTTNVVDRLDEKQLANFEENFKENVFMTLINSKGFNHD